MELSPGKSEFLCLHNSHVKLLFIYDKPQVTQFKHNEHGDLPPIILNMTFIMVMAAITEGEGSP